MGDLTKQSCDCTSTSVESSCSCSGLEMLPLFQAPKRDEPCCGPPAGPPSSPYEIPGYNLCSFVEGFIDTPAGKVPRVSTSMNLNDRLGTIYVRMGFGRNDYKVAPGLYGMGDPDDQAPVLVTANYKLSFDHLRRSLSGTHAWILVLDTCGINVWCAAGKGTFGTRELIHRVQQTQLAKIVRHRRLILPQLGATGVAGYRVKKACGFEVLWGPIRAEDIKSYLKNGKAATEAMRRVTFTLIERLVLVPVEITLLRKHLLWALGAILVLSVIGPHIFSFSTTLHRAALALSAALAGVLGGCVMVPVLLPFISGRSFALKGGIVGLITGIFLFGGLWMTSTVGPWPAVALTLLAAAISSFLAMNFTGSTPFTSPSGVEKEMRRFIPIQLSLAVVAIVIWVGSAFS